MVSQATTLDEVTKTAKYCRQGMPGPWYTPTLKRLRFLEPHLLKNTHYFLAVDHKLFMLRTTYFISTHLAQGLAHSQ